MFTVKITLMPDENATPYELEIEGADNADLLISFQIAMSLLGIMILLLDGNLLT